jgi:hypothetical protein
MSGTVARMRTSSISATLTGKRISTLSCTADADGLIKASRSSSTASGRKSLAVALLVEGRASAFIDFFTLTHPTTGSTTSNAGISSGSSASSVNVPEEGLAQLQQLLRQEDAAQSGNDVGRAFDANRHLARFFSQLGQLTTAAHFFTKCLKVCEIMSVLQGGDAEINSQTECHLFFCDTWHQESESWGLSLCVCLYVFIISIAINIFIISVVINE